MMTGVGIVMPVFGRRMDELGGGVEELGLMLLAFAAAQLVMSPVAGWLADRIGRRPIILVALVSFVLTNLLYLVAPTNAWIIAIRGLGGALTAGLVPASMAMVGDVASDEERARWVGLVMGSYGVGFVLGPVFGGALYDWLGFAAPFLGSAALGTVAFVAGIVLVRETLPRPAAGDEAVAPAGLQDLLDSLPRPLFPLAAALFVHFAPTFAFAFVEPELVFHFYDTLQFSTLQFGVVVGTYGIAMVIGQVRLGRLADRIGRQLTLIIGLALTTSFYLGLPVIHAFPAILAVAVISGLGQGMATTSASAWLLDLSREDNRSLVSSLGTAAASLAGVLGPTGIVLASARLGSTGVFLSAGAALLVGLAVVVGVYLHERLSSASLSA